MPPRRPIDGPIPGSAAAPRRALTRIAASTADMSVSSVRFEDDARRRSSQSTAALAVVGLGRQGVRRERRHGAGPAGRQRPSTTWPPALGRVRGGEWREALAVMRGQVRDGAAATPPVGRLYDGAPTAAAWPRPTAQPAMATMSVRSLAPPRALSPTATTAIRLEATDAATTDAAVMPEHEDATSDPPAPDERAVAGEQRHRPSSARQASGVTLARQPHGTRGEARRAA